MVDPAALYDRIGELERELEATQHELVRASLLAKHGVPA